MINFNFNVNVKITKHYDSFVRNLDCNFFLVQKLYSNSFKCKEATWNAINTKKAITVINPKHLILWAWACK